MKVIISESQMKLFEKIFSNGTTDAVSQVNDEKKFLEDYIESKGQAMTDITNGKTYMVQYLKALSDLVGIQYAMCAPVRKDGTYGAFYVKPMKSFTKLQTNPMAPKKEPLLPKPNLYQLGNY